MAAGAGLGWFSIGLGLLKPFGARRVSSALGIQGSEWLIRACYQGLKAGHARLSGPRRNYRDRSGFPKGLAHARNTQG